MERSRRARGLSRSPARSTEAATRMGTLVERQSECVARSDVDRFFQHNAAFHELFVDASENRTLAEMYRQLMAHMGRYRMRSLALRGSLRRSVSEHRAILRAVRAGDAERAARLLGDHIRVPQRRLETASDE